MRHALRTAVVLAALAASACAPEERDDDGEHVEQIARPIVGGAVDEGDPAVVMLVSYAPDHSVFETCTASVVAKDVLLTAAHCIDPATHPSYGYGVFPGADASAYPTANTLIPKLLPVKETHAHPDYDPSPPFVADIGVVILEAPLDVAPLPIQRDPIGADIVGKAARIVGYGQIKYKEYNAKRHQAETSVQALGDADTVTVGDEDHRSCVGDSGGPALVAMDGVERIVGVDSYTDLAGCLQPAHYRRPDVYTAFLDTYVPPAAPGGAGGAGAGGGSTGGAGGSTSGKGGGCAIAPMDAGASGAGRWSLLATVAALSGAAVRRARRRREPGATGRGAPRG